jgi:hypothetical protein
VSLPSGWAFDPLWSSLTDLVFLHWQCPDDDQLFVRVRHSYADSSASDDEWAADVSSHLPEEVTRVERRDGPWLALECRGRAGSPAPRC